jgi:hypothetical protein
MIRNTARNHKHQCPKCDFVWSHPDSVATCSDDLCAASHTCPRCGCHKVTGHNSTYIRYQGPEKPDKTFRRPHRGMREARQRVFIVAEYDFRVCRTFERGDLRSIYEDYAYEVIGVRRSQATAIRLAQKHGTKRPKVI